MQVPGRFHAWRERTLLSPAWAQKISGHDQNRGHPVKQLSYEPIIGTCGVNVHRPHLRVDYGKTTSLTLKSGYLSPKLRRPVGAISHSPVKGFAPWLIIDFPGLERGWNLSANSTLGVESKTVANAEGGFDDANFRPHRCICSTF